MNNLTKLPLTQYTVGYTIANDPGSIHTIYVSTINIKDALNEAEFNIRECTEYEIVFIKRTYP